MPKSKHKRAGLNVALQKLVRGPGDSVALASARQSFRPESYGTLVQLLRTNRKLRKRFCHAPFPQSVSTLKNQTILLKPLDLDKEILWAKAYLIQYADQLSQFLKLTTDYENLFLKSRFAECQLILDNLEQRFGVSLWLIKNKIALLQTANGSEAQRRYTTKTEATAIKDGFAAFIIHFLGLRNDSAISFEWFTRFYLNYIKKLQLPSDIADYVTFHILLDEGLSIEASANILRLEFSGAIIDYYESLVTLARLAIARDRKDLFGAFSSAIEPLLGKTNDPRLEPLLFALTGSGWDPAHVQNLQAFDSFVSGDLQRSFELACEQLETRADNPDLLILAGRSLTPTTVERPGEPRLFEKIIDEIASDCGVNRHNGESFDLLRFSINLAGQKVADALWGYTQREYSWNPMESADPSLLYSLASSRVVDPLRITELTYGPRKKYVGLASTLHGDRLSVRYAKALTREENETLPNDLSWEAQEFVTANVAMETDQFDRALAHSKQMMQSTNGYYQNSAVRIISYCFLQLDEILDVVRFVTSAYLSNRPIHLLPVSEVTELLDRPTRRRLENEISISILLDLAIKNSVSSLEHQHRYAYEDFLLSHGVQRPSELRSIQSQFDRTKLIYFLRFICIESVMDVSIVFSGSRDIAEERVSVCRFLTELDPDNAPLYQNEIKEIIRRLMIQQRVLEVQQSKIYVDTDSIKKKIDKSFKESFNRYKILLAAQSSSEMDQLLAERREKVDTLDIEGLLNLPLPQHEMTDLFTSMVIQLRDQFVSSTEHGLDGYLSVRIRHGTLQGQLRGVLQAAHLLTQRDSITGGYQTQNELIATLNTSDPTLASDVGNRLATFTNDVDLLIYEIINEWIQVKKLPNQKGLFDFTLTIVHTNVLSAYVTVGTSLDEFLERAFRFFLELLQFHLTNVRRLFRHDVKLRFVSLLTELKADLDALRVTPEISKLIRNATNAQTELLRAIDRVIEWFHLSQSTDREPFFIEDAISISLESVRTFTQGIEAEINLKADTVIVVEGMMLTGLVDILTIIFENIIRHSGLGGRPKANITVQDEQKDVRITVENEIAESSETEESQSRISIIKHAIMENRYGQSINREGGTGFHKIWKILNHDFRIPSLGAPAELEFGFSKNQTFVVTFAIPIRERTDGNSHS